MSAGLSTAVDLGFAAGWRLVRALPERVAQGAFRLGAELATRRGGTGVLRLRANLARLVPHAGPAELDAIVRAGLRSYARYWCEVFRLPATDPARVHRGTAVAGAEPLLAAVDVGRGAIVALPHSGNWDAAGVWLVEELRARGAEPAFTTVVERLRPESLFRRFAAYRESLGFEVVTADDGAGAYRAMTRRLRRGGVVCLVADRDLGGGGVEVAFLGERARFPSGPARLAALTGAVLLPAVPSFRADGWAISFGPPVPVPDRASVPKAVQDLADTFAALLAAAPADWHMLQPVWSPDRVPVPG